MYTLTAAQADEGEGTKNLKLQNVKGQGGVRACVRAISKNTCPFHLWRFLARGAGWIWNDLGSSDVTYGSLVWCRCEPLFLCRPVLWVASS